MAYRSDLLVIDRKDQLKIENLATALVALWVGLVPGDMVALVGGKG